MANKKFHIFIFLTTWLFISVPISCLWLSPKLKLDVYCEFEYCIVWVLLCLLLSYGCLLYFGLYTYIVSFVVIIIACYLLTYYGIYQPWLEHHTDCIYQNSFGRLCYIWNKDDLVLQARKFCSLHLSYAQVSDIRMIEAVEHSQNSVNRLYIQLQKAAELSIIDRECAFQNNRNSQIRHMVIAGGISAVFSFVVSLASGKISL